MLSLLLATGCSARSKLPEEVSTAKKSCCVAEEEQQLCVRLSADCGMLVTTGICGFARTVNCGGCPGGQHCATDNTCVCNETDSAICTRNENVALVERV
jgi:hypothetical protein